MGAKRYISKSLRNTVNDLAPPDTPGRNEIDSAAETSCAGLNWIPLLYTGDVANVFGFNGVETDTAIPIATCATKVIAKSGIPYILICPPMLYYGRGLSSIRISCGSKEPLLKTTLQLPGRKTLD